MKEKIRDNVRASTSRTPVSGRRDILAVKGIPSDVIPRWVNDKEDRLQRFLDGGWTFWTDKNTRVGERTVNADKATGNVVSKYVGSGITAYLMVIDRDLYEQDQWAKEENLRDIEASMKNPDLEGRYGNIKISEQDV